MAKLLGKQGSDRFTKLASYCHHYVNEAKTQEDQGGKAPSQVS